MNSNQAILTALQKEIEATERYTGYAGLFEKTIEMLRANIREEAASKKGAKKPYKIIEKMIKDADTNIRPAFGQAHPSSYGYGFIDGHRIFLTDDLMGYEVAEMPFNIDQMMTPSIKEAIHNITIDVAELKYYIKVVRASGRGELRYNPYLFLTPDGMAAINPVYLLDLIEYSGSNVIKYNSRRAPIIAENNTALLLPVNHNKEIEDYYKWRVKWFNEDILTAIKKEVA